MLRFTSTPGRRLAAPIVALTALASAVLLVAETGVAAPPSSCRGTTCTAALRVGGAAVRWASPELFYPENERLYAGPRVGAQPLALLRSFGPGLCRHRFFGAGMTVVVKACGVQTPLRVRAVRLKRGARNLEIPYVAWPMLDGASPPPESGSPMLLRPITR